jgi:hypothetical protein
MEKLYLHPIDRNRFIKKSEYFKILFGEEYMNSVEKGRIKEYKNE